jgi:hypothetical protein
MKLRIPAFQQKKRNNAMELRQIERRSAKMDKTPREIFPPAWGVTEKIWACCRGGSDEAVTSAEFFIRAVGRWYSQGC